MPPKAKLPAPIDRPLSRAYLREFGGWSTAYPPGLSDPTSLRIMENVLINRDGSARVRPGLRYLSYDTPPTELLAGTGIDREVVGTHEAFFLNDGSKAYLFAVREADGKVGFRVLQFDTTSQTVLTLTEAGFTVPQTEDVLEFTAATKYVKYLQIDNKIFALSDAGEVMRLFQVGANKTARKLSSVERPAWAVADKLTVRHPDATWVNSGAPVSTRTNKIRNPSFETGLEGWAPGSRTTIGRWTGGSAQSGSCLAWLELTPVRKNYVPQPLHDVATTGSSGWDAGSGTDAFGVEGAYVYARNHDFSDGLQGVHRHYMNSPYFAVEAGAAYRISHDVELGGNAGNQKFGLLYRFFNGSGTQLHEGQFGPYAYGSPGRALYGATVTAPAGTTHMQVYPFAEGNYDGNLRALNLYVKNVLICRDGEADTFFSGASGADYFWVGGANSSASVYAPPNDIYGYTENMTVTPGTTYTVSLYGRPFPTTEVENVELYLIWRDSSNVTISAEFSSGVETASMTRFSKTAVAPANAATVIVQYVVKNADWSDHHELDAVLLEASSSLGAYFDGSFTDTSTLVYEWNGTAHFAESTETVWAAGVTIPAAETPTVNTLISSTAANNTYNFGFFYTFFNEIGDSAASQVTVVRAQRRWSAWRWETPNDVGEPSGTPTADPTLVADQLVAFMPESVFNAARAQGALGWNLYMFTWSDQDTVPVQALLIDKRTFGDSSLYGSFGWGRATPVIVAASEETAELPSATNRYNYSNPSTGGQGIVAADRMILVKDPAAAAVIRWTSNQQGSYTDFSASRGGGYKTLTSGNLYIPACVKLWQNPQSADTLTILCQGTDGHSTGYYMAPAQVASQSETVNIMGFEETTATPGTVSPYGCEVLNNTLYHPLDDVLMKSTASNYNINHKEVTELIRNKWVQLLEKGDIVSSQLDNRLYYIVNNPEGVATPTNCMGNEVWVFDAQAEAGSWSRLLIPAVSLRKIERNDHVYMSVTTPDGIYYLDPDYDRDDYVDAADGRKIKTRYIPWRLETNTQGANRAHDAWAHLQQLNMILGNFRGSMKYGLRSWDINGKPVKIEKLVHNLSLEDSMLPFDLEDYLLVRRDLKEWFFYAESILDDEGEVARSFGQINLVQYRYTPSTVNTGYEYGSVESFEYSRAALNPIDPGFTTNGTPQPMIDTRQP